jgi:dihydroflavonol-4-reductase
MTANQHTGAAPSPAGPVLVTGGTGFLGAYVLSALVERGIPVRAIRRSAALPQFLPPATAEKVEWVEGDVLDVVSLEEAAQGAWGLIHSAAVVSFHAAERRRMYQVNIDGTANVVNAALEAGVQRFVHVSSVAALGRTTREETVSEKKQWEESSSNTHYAISKHHAEMEAWRGFAEGLQGTIINPSTILGYGNWHQSSCAIFRNAWKGFPWYTPGINGFVGVKDVAEAAVQLLLSPLHQQRFIVNAENWPFRRLLDTIADGFDRKRPAREATPFLGGLAWRLEAIKARLTRSKPLLTRETARVAQSKTAFDNSALLAALPSFRYQPLESVISEACAQYRLAVERGEIQP